MRHVKALAFGAALVVLVPLALVGGGHAVMALARVLGDVVYR